MAKTYTLPTFNLPSGAVVVKFISSWESGSATQTHSYILDMSPLILEIEVEGGSTANDSIDIDIYDKDDLFNTTFIPSMSSSNILNMELYLDGVRLFRGFIDKSSIKIDNLYSVTDGSTSTINKISFTAIWNIAGLQYVSIQTLVDSIITNNATDLLNYGDTVHLITVDKLFNRILQNIPDQTISYTGSIVSPYYLASDSATTWLQYAFVGAGAFSVNSVPLGSGFIQFKDEVSSITTKSGFRGCFNAGVDMSDINTATSGSSLASDKNERPPTSFYNYSNVYELLINLLKCFGLLLKADYSNVTYTSVITITTRESGSLISPSNLLTSSYSPMNRLSIDSFDIKMKGALVSHKENLFSVNQQTLSEELPIGVMDFISNPKASDDTAQNKNIWDSQIDNQLNYYYNHLGLSSQYDNNGVANTNYRLHARYIHKNSNKFQDPLVNTSVDPYWHTSNMDITFSSGGHAGGVITTTDPLVANTRYSNIWVKGELGSSFSKDCLFIFFYRTSVAINGFYATAEILTSYTGTTIPIANSVTGFDGLITDTNTITDYFYSTSSSYWRMGAFYFKQYKPQQGFAAIKLSIIQAPTVMTISFSDFYCFEGYDSSAKAMLDEYYKYFTKETPSYIRKYNGIISALPADYITVSSSNYYIKKVSKDLVNNETEIEAINYST